MASSGKFDGVDFSQTKIEALTTELRQLGRGFRCIRREFVTYWKQGRIQREADAYLCQCWIGHLLYANFTDCLCLLMIKKMSDRTLQIPTYQVGGSLPSSAPSYVKRTADDELLTALQQGEFCYVFNARQMGKSSLRVQTTERLQKLGVRCGIIDITSIGTQEVTPEQWYASMMGTLTKNFQLDLPLVSWWRDRTHLSLINRFSDFLETVLLVQVSEPIVIFIDEIDSVLGLNFSTDDFFALIRACYNRRAENPAYQRLSFALFGVATPSSLIADLTRTPFNIGKAIKLAGFQYHEALPLLSGFPKILSNPEAILKRILYWTEGQPFLTQKLCQLVAAAADLESKPPLIRGVGGIDIAHGAENLATDEVRSQRFSVIAENLATDEVRSQRFSVIAENLATDERLAGDEINSSSPPTPDTRHPTPQKTDWVDNLVQSRIIENWEAQDEPEHLRTIRDRLLFDEQKVGRLLGLYQRIFLGNESGISLDNSPEKIELMLMGLVREQGERLRVKNRLYEQVFDWEWIDEQISNLRPYSQAIKAWIISGYQDNYWLLQGQALRDVLAWSNDKQLSNVDYQFLAASQERDRAVTEQMLEAERLRTVETRLELEEKRSLEQQKYLKKQRILLKRQRVLLVIVSAMTLSSMTLGFMAYRESQQRAIGELKSIVLSSEALFASNKWLDALVQAVKGKERLEKLGKVDPKLEKKVDAVLEQVVLSVQEQNRLIGHDAAVLGVDYSPDGQQIATSSVDKTVKLWSRDGTLRQTLTGHNDLVRVVKFSPDGQLLASGGDDKTVKIWTRDGQLLDNLVLRTNVWGMAFSPDSRRLIIGGADSSLELWERGSQTLKQFSGKGGGIRAVAWSPDGQKIAAANTDNTVTVWNVDGKLEQVLQGHNAPVYAIAWSPDGSAIASGGIDGTIHLWKADGSPITTIQAHDAAVKELRFSPDGQVLASGSWDKTLKLWNRNGTLRTTFRGHNAAIWGIAFSPDGSAIVSAGADNMAIVWETKNRFHSTIYGLTGLIRGLAFNQDGNLIATSGTDKTIKIWQLDGTLVRTISAHDGALGNIVSSPDGEILASGSEDKTLKLWHWDGTPIRTFTGYPATVLSLAWHPQKDILASGTGNGEIWIWGVNGTLQKKFLANPAHLPIWDLEFSPDGQILITSGNDNTLQLLNLEGELQKTLTAHQATIWNITFYPNGQRWASASGDTTVKLWQRDGTLLQTLQGHQAAVWGLAFSPMPIPPYGSILATSSIDETVKLWTDDGILLITLKGHSGGVRAVAFHPHKPILASAADDQTLMLWNIEEILQLKPLPFACDWLRDYLRTNTALQPDDAELCGGKD